MSLATDFASIGGSAAAVPILPPNSGSGNSFPQTSKMRKPQLKRACLYYTQYMNILRNGTQAYVDSLHNAYEPGRLYCRTGFHLQIHQNGKVNGSRSEATKLSIMEFLSVSFGLIMIKGHYSDKYLCMSSGGKLVGQNVPTSDCIFMERPVANYFNTYASCAYPAYRKRKRWHIAINRKGRGRRGKKARRKGQYAQFLVIKLQKDELERVQKRIKRRGLAKHYPFWRRYGRRGHMGTGKNASRHFYSISRLRGGAGRRRGRTRARSGRRRGHGGRGRSRKKSGGRRSKARQNRRKYNQYTLQRWFASAQLPPGLSKEEKIKFKRLVDADIKQLAASRSASNRITLLRDRRRISGRLPQLQQAHSSSSSAEGSSEEIERAARRRRSRSLFDFLLNRPKINVNR